MLSANSAIGANGTIDAISFRLRTLDHLKVMTERPIPAPSNEMGMISGRAITMQMSPSNATRIIRPLAAKMDASAAET